MPITNTFETYGAVGNREDLADIIYQISPEETPFLSTVGRKPVSATYHEWQTDTLANVNLTNNRAEGAEWAYQVVDPTTRVGNRTQISSKEIIISRTQETVSKAGRSSELARETAKKGKELKRDMEGILLSNQASDAGSAAGATNRTLGGFRAWLVSNTNVGTGGSDGGFSAGNVSAATDGTERAFAKPDLDDVILKTHTSGGNMDIIMMSAYNKTVFATFMSDANVAPFRYAADKGQKNAIIATADIYASSFGELAVISNRQMTNAGSTVARNVFVMDTDMASVGMLDDIKRENPAKTGDATKRVLVCEYTLVMNNEAGHGVVADTFGLSATT